MKWSTLDIARITCGQHVGDEQLVSGVAIDSRSVHGSELFIPLHGSRDGHEWIPDALRRGAVACLTERATTEGTAIMVDDTSRALTMLGSAARARAQGVVIGITGSVGKTTTKDMTRAVLARTFITHASALSYNNEIGVPFTLSTAPDDVECLVLELGARSPGDIATLCQVARPTIGIVTRVAAVHTELFGDLATVARTKSELVQALPAEGTAVLNGDDPNVAEMATMSAARVLFFGASGDVRAKLLAIGDDLRPLVRISTPDGTIDVRLSARGEHQIGNAAAAVATGYLCGIPLSEAAAALETAELSPFRMSLERGRHGIRVLDDSYNANPASVEAGLRALAALPARRRVAVLGIMAELGTLEAAEHHRIAQLAQLMDIEVVAVGTTLYDTEHLRAQDVLERLSTLGDGDVVLVKGSRVAGLDQIAAHLRDG